MRIRFALVNNTKWNTMDLRKLCHRIIKETGSGKHHIITINTSRRGRIHGLAHLRGRSIWMYVLPVKYQKWTPVYHPTEKTIGSDGKEYRKIEKFDKNMEDATFDTYGFAQVLTHEIHHNLGLEHKDMVKLSDIDCSYVKDYEVKINV